MVEVSTFVKQKICSSLCLNTKLIEPTTFRWRRHLANATPSAPSTLSRWEYFWNLMTPIQNDQHHPIGPRRRTPVRATEPFPLLVMFENDFLLHLVSSKKSLIAIKHDMPMIMMTVTGRCPSSSSLVSATSSPSPLPPTQTPKQPYLGWRSQVQFR